MLQYFLQLMIHQKSNPECLRTPGRCYYFEYCGFQSDNLNELKAHMENNTQSHIEAVTAKLSKMQSLCESVRNAVRMSVNLFWHSTIWKAAYVMRLRVLKNLKIHQEFWLRPVKSVVYKCFTSHSVGSSYYEVVKFMT